MITGREEASVKASIVIGEPWLRTLEAQGLVVIAADELAVLDRAREQVKELQGRGNELLEEARAARRCARKWRVLCEAAAERLLDMTDLREVNE